MSLDSVATVTCQSGYTTVGGAVRTCLADGTWSGVEGRCTRKWSEISEAVIVSL